MSGATFVSLASLWWLLLLPLFLPCAVWVGVLLLQAICALLPVPAVLLSSQRPRIAILIPAHDEESGIARTLHSLLPQLKAGDRILVVADNCSDDTARVAAEAGADVVERSDATQRGKGYALDFGMRHLASDAPEVVIVVDADCVVEAAAIDCLARACIANGRPAQALYLMQATASNGASGQLREFAWIVRNLVRPLGWLRLGLPCQLMGTGMAFPWHLMASLSFGGAHLVEDMQLGVALAQCRAAPMFCPQAVVRSEFPGSAGGVEQQRRRWEHGHLGMIARVPALLVEAMAKSNAALAALAIDMSVPPLALLALLLLSLGALSLFVPMATASSFALAFFLTFTTAILLAWWRHGRTALNARTLLLVPFYALAKLPLYLGFLRRRQVEWVRSSRD